MSYYETLHSDGTYTPASQSLTVGQAIGLFAIILTVIGAACYAAQVYLF